VERDPPESGSVGGYAGALGRCFQSTPEGDVRRAFYLAYNDSYCDYLKLDEVEQRMENGEPVVSATYLTPYPPGFPVLVPGQMFSQQILAFMQSLDTPEVHGYRPGLGYRVYVDTAPEIAATARPAAPPDRALPIPAAPPPPDGDASCGVPAGSGLGRPGPAERESR
jgi:Orn/Lys/Arg decarboxylase, C-terminal domain